MAYKKYTVKQGDCITSIAFNKGFYEKTIWDHPDNAKLKNDRKDMNILQPGDKVVIPDKTQKEVSCALEKRHRFKRKGVPAKFRLQILDNKGKPRAQIPYEFNIERKMIRDYTDGDGVIEIFIPNNITEGKLRLDNEKQILHIKFGHLQPEDQKKGSATPDSNQTTSTTLPIPQDRIGIRQRLYNLGFLADIEESDPALLTIALEDFQDRIGLKVTGKLDEETIEKLKDMHDIRQPLPDYDPTGPVPNTEGVDEKPYPDKPGSPKVITPIDPMAPPPEPPLETKGPPKKAGPDAFIEEDLGY